MTKNFNLYTVTTNSFREFNIISNKSKRKLEAEYYSVKDQGIVSNIEETEDEVIFIHNRWLKSLPIERLEYN